MQSLEFLLEQRLEQGEDLAQAFEHVVQDGFPLHDGDQVLFLERIKLLPVNPRVSGIVISLLRSYHVSDNFIHRWVIFPSGRPRTSLPSIPIGRDDWFVMTGGPILIDEEWRGATFQCLEHILIPIIRYTSGITYEHYHGDMREMSLGAWWRDKSKKGRRDRRERRKRRAKREKREKKGNSTKRVEQEERYFFEPEFLYYFETGSSCCLAANNTLIAPNRLAALSYLIGVDEVVKLLPEDRPDVTKSGFKDYRSMIEYMSSDDYVAEYHPELCLLEDIIHQPLRRELQKAGCEVVILTTVMGCDGFITEVLDARDNSPSFIVKLED